MSVHYRIGFKSMAGGPVMFDPRYATEEEARKAALAQIDKGHGMHYIWKVTTEEVAL
jgi:hypothetical protein